MEYSKEFIELINRLSPTNDEHLQFVGFGNPNSRILLIGKECGDVPNSFNEINCNKPNLKHWVKNISAHPLPIDAWHNNPDAVFNPEHPFKGLPMKELSGGHTWRNYQKIVAGITNQCSSEIVDFHQYAFITELNSVTSKYSKYSSEAKDSIEKRTQQLLCAPFYRNFPITIVCCGHYLDQYNINLEEIFDVKWEGRTVEVTDNTGKKCGWINVHYADGRILIHTRHLSMCSGELINKIIELCRPYY